MSQSCANTSRWSRRGASFLAVPWPATPRWRTAGEPRSAARLAPTAAASLRVYHPVRRSLSLLFGTCRLFAIDLVLRWAASPPLSPLAWSVDETDHCLFVPRLACLWAATLSFPPPVSLGFSLPSCTLRRGLAPIAHPPLCASPIVASFAPLRIHSPPPCLRYSLSPFLSGCLVPASEVLARPVLPKRGRTRGVRVTGTRPSPSPHPVRGATTQTSPRRAPVVRVDRRRGVAPSSARATKKSAAPPNGRPVRGAQSPPPPTPS